MRALINRPGIFVIFITTILLCSSPIAIYELATLCSPDSVQNEVNSVSLRPSQSMNPSFVRNLGQLDDDSIEYYLSYGAYHIGLSESKLTVIDNRNEEQPVRFSITFPNANKIHPVGIGSVEANLNFYMGNMQLTNVPQYSEVLFSNLYGGIDLRYFLAETGLKYEFIVAPGIDASVISMEVSDSLSIEVCDSTVIGYNSLIPGEVCYQDGGLLSYQDERVPIPSQFISKSSNSNRYGFLIDAYDISKPLVIDPWIVNFSTYIGGENGEQPMKLAIDNEGNVFTASSAESGFPLKNAYQDTHAGGYSDVLVSKFTSEGARVFSTYFGGNESEYCRDIATDLWGNCYVTGHTSSLDFPMVNALYVTNSGDSDAFVFKLDSDGLPIFSTYLGGNDTEWSNAIDTDSEGNVYISGATFSHDYPVLNAFQDEYIPGNYAGDCFVTKLTSDGSSLVYSTYIGGQWLDEGIAIAVDEDGNCYVVGRANSIDFPTTSGAFDETYNGDGEAFVLKLNSTGNGLIYSTYIGGNQHEQAEGVYVDSDGYCYVTGWTDSPDFPTVNGYQLTNVSTYPRTDAFVSKFSPDGGTLNFSTYLGGSASDYGSNIAVDDDGNCYIVGVTMSVDFPTTYTGNTIQAQEEDIGAYISILNVTGSGLKVSTVIAGAWSAIGIAIGSENEVYISGMAEDDDMYTINAFQSTYGGLDDGFLMRLRFENGPPDITLLSHENNAILYPGTTISLSVQDDTCLDHVIYNWDSEVNNTLQSPFTLQLPSIEGEYNLHVFANDTDNQWSSAIFHFTVSEDAPTTNSSNTGTSPLPPFIITLVLIIGGISVVIVVVFLWFKKK